MMLLKILGVTFGILLGLAAIIVGVLLVWVGLAI